MTTSRPRFALYLLTAFLILFGAAPAHEANDETTPALQFEEATFEANGSPLYVLNARVRVKNVGHKGYRGTTVHFYYRLESQDEWTLIGKRILPGILPGNSAVCDLLTSSEGLPFVSSDGEVRHCQYRMEVHNDNQVTVKEGEFHPACLFEGEHHDHHSIHGAESSKAYITLFPSPNRHSSLSP